MDTQPDRPGRRGSAGGGHRRRRRTSRSSEVGGRRRGRLLRTPLVGLLVVATVAGCGGGGPTAEPGPGAPPAASGDPRALRGVCPETVVIQTNWWPQAEYGAVYRLLGQGSTVDTGRKRVSAPLVVGEVDTGVRVEIRAGGPANAFTPAAKALYLDRSVLLGGVDVDQAVQVAGSGQPVRAVFAPLELSPVVLMWDPTQHPGWNTISDIGQTDSKVLYFQGSTYMDYLVGAGILRKSQVDSGYDGTPSRWVAERGRIVQQGFLTNEVYAYQNELPQWKRPVAWTLVADSGYPIYPETLAIRPDRQAELGPCLRKLVPIMQRSAADYLANPTPTNDLIVRLVREFGAFAYSSARAAYAVKVMRENGILGNGGNATIGDFDTARVQRILDVVRPILTSQRQRVPDSLGAVDLFTNDFIDPAIGAKS